MKPLDYVTSLGVLAAGMFFFLALATAAYSFGRLLADVDDTWFLRFTSLSFYLIFTLAAVLTRRAIGGLYEMERSDVQ